MIKILLTFIFFTAVVAFVIKTVRKMTGKEKWMLTKLLGYSIICSSLTFVTIAIIVLLF